MFYVIGFTEADCSRLYYKAIRDNPTVTLHIAKAMTIGPSQVSKTSLFYHLLGLPPPDFGSTPVIETARTVSVCPSNSKDAEVDVGQRVVERCSYEARMCVVGDKWMQVNSDSGIFSLLTFLYEKIDALVAANQSSIIEAEAASEPVASKSKALNTQPRIHKAVCHGTHIQPSSDTVVSRFLVPIDICALLSITW